MAYSPKLVFVATKVVIGLCMLIGLWGADEVPGGEVLYMGERHPVSFPAEWRKELDAIPELPPREVDAVRVLAAVLHTAEVLQDVFTARKMRTDQLDLLQRSCMYFFAHTYHIGRAIYDLLGDGYGIAPLMLVRSILEADIDLAYLWKCGEISGSDDELRAWGEYHERERGSVARMWREVIESAAEKGVRLPELVTAEEASRHIQDAEAYKQRHGRDHWARKEARKVFERAKAVDQVNGPPGFFFQEDYVTVYKYTSGFVHPSVWAANAYMDEHDGHLTFDFGPNRKEIGTAASMAARFLMAMLYMVKQILNLDVDLDGQLDASARGAGIAQISSE